MQTLIKIVVALVVILLTLTGAAYLLPGSYRVERSIAIEAPAEVVFAQINDLRLWQAWTVWGSVDPELKYDTSPVSAGTGAWQKWSSPQSGSGELKLTASEPPRRVGYDLYFPDFDARSSGEILLEPEGTGVKVTWSNAGRLGNNPVIRWFGLAYDRLIGGDFEAGLARLKTVCEVKPSALEAPSAPAAPEVSTE